ncbi:myosin XI D [Trifolium repens]|nr:myosin XI D [Trifolium repens]
MSVHLSTHVYEKLENGHHVVEDQKATETQTVTPVKKFGTESDSKLRRSYIERRHENVDSLINCVMKNTGFHHGKPIAAFTIYKCLLHWKSFEAESTSVFDRLIQMIGSAIENQDDNDLMAYWLSNTSALLFLVQQRSGGSNDAAPVRKPPNPTSLFGRMTMAPRTSKGVLRSGRSFSKDSPMGHWQSIVESLNTILCTMKENFVRN